MGNYYSARDELEDQQLLDVLDGGYDTTVHAPDDDYSLPTLDASYESELHSILSELAEGPMRRLERECFGAWRAGYDFLYVVTGYDASPRMGLHIGYIPSNRETYPHPPDVRVERYDLRGITREEIEEARRDT